MQVPPEKRYFSPLKVEEGYAYTPNEGDDIEQKSHIVMGWLLDQSIDLKRNLEVHLLSSLLYDNSASPMQHLLETSPLGQSPSALCGMDDSQYEMIFLCGLEGCRADSAAEFEQSIITLLEKLAAEGLPQEHIEASLHQLELQQREIGGDHYPYGLQLILNALSPATHRGDILAFMDLEGALASLREAIEDRDYIPQLIKSLLLDNPHRVTLTLKPDAQLSERQQSAEQATLAAIKAAMSKEEKQAIIDQANALDARQQQEEDLDILPKVDLSDIPKETRQPSGTRKALGVHTLDYYSTGTNGLSYQQIICPLPELSTEQLAALPYYTLCLTEMGIGEHDYLAVQQRQSQVVGNINAYYSLRNHIDDEQQWHAYITLTAKALSQNQTAMNELMVDTLQHARFDESHRIKELVAQAKAGREQSVTGSGHSLAMQAACAGFNPTAAAIHQLMGLGGVQSIKALHQQLEAGDTAPLQTHLEAIHQQLTQAQKQLLLVTEEKHLHEQLSALEVACQPILNNTPNTSQLVLPSTTIQTVRQAWVSNSQVHFCAKAYPTVPMSHPDAPALSVLGGVLRNGFLHRAIREQGGAYGGGASQDSNSASFRFYSYRDPRFGETLEDFDRAIDWLLQGNLDALQVEESILGVIGSLDKPGSPAGEARQHFHAQLTGRTDEKRAQFRQGIVDVTADDLYRVATNYLHADKASTVVVTGKHGIEAAQQAELELIYV